jgi:predicted kinase
MKKENQYLFILCGEAFSGKSTISEKISEMHKATIIGRNKIYFALDSILALEDTPDEDDDELWESLWSVAVQGAKNQLLLGNSVVFDDNCFFLHQREELRSLAKSIGIKAILIYLDIPTDTLKKRKERNKIEKSRHDVPSSWLAEDAQKFERPTENENPLIFTENDSVDELLKKLADIL